MRKGLICLAVAGLFAATAQADQDLIDAESFGSPWPFTFEEAYVACHAGRAVTVMDAESGRMYPLNGAANTQAAKLGLEPLAPVWRDNPELPGTKVSVGLVIEKGLTLCQ